MRKLFLKKTCIWVNCFIFGFIVLILNVKTKAMYVFDKETFYSGITSVEEELSNNNTSALNENDNIVKIVENSNASSLILNVYKLKNPYKAYRDNLNTTYANDSNDNNIILACFGKMNEVGYLKILNLSFELKHIFSKKYSQYNNEYHIATCVFGREYKEKHNLKRITSRYNTSVIMP